MPIDNSAGRSIIFCKGRLAQLARASRLHREGRGFESLNAHSSSEKRNVSRSFFRFRSGYLPQLMVTTNAESPDSPSSGPGRTQLFRSG